MQPVFELCDWVVRRDGLVDIGPVDFCLGEGEVVTLMGPSGVGKTTFLLASLGYGERGLEVRGTRRQRGATLSAREIPVRALYIPQQVPFNPNWEVEGFLRRLPVGRSDERGNRKNRIRQILQELGISHRRRATVAEISGGESQRAALAQMLVLEPELLVGDEFVSALDPGIESFVLGELRRHVSRAKGGAILALHDAQAALLVSDRIYLLWPSAVDRKPWSIPKGSRGWHPNILYTLLCLGRWATDFPRPTSVRLLAAQMHLWLQEEKNFSRFTTDAAEADAVRLSEGGGFEPVGIPDNHRLADLAGAPDAWTEMQPVRVSADGEVAIGVRIPRPGRHPLYVLA